MERIALTPADAGDTWLSERGVWKSAQRDAGRTAVMSCPDCGFVASLSEHEVDEAGNVSPMVDCANAWCGFRGFVVLSGWSEN